LPSTITRPVSGRVTHEEAAAFEAQAARYGLTRSEAVATLIRDALLVDRAAAGTNREEA
jgi:hypothetical protein